MGLAIGTSLADALKVGAADVDKAYVGSVEVWGGGIDPNAFDDAIVAMNPLIFYKCDDTISQLVDAMGGDPWQCQSGATGGLAPLVSDGGTAVASGGSGIAASLSVPASIAGPGMSFRAKVNIPAANPSGTLLNLGNLGGPPVNGWGVGFGSTSIGPAGKQLIFHNPNVAWVQTGYYFGTGNYDILITRSAANLFTVYVNGSSVWSGTFAPATAHTEIQLGGATGALPLSSNVTVDEVAFFPTALAAGRAAAHYNGGAGDAAAILADNPVIYLHLDDAITAGSTSLFDSAPGGRHMTYFGMPQFQLPSLLTGGAGKSIRWQSNKYGRRNSDVGMNSSQAGLVMRLRPSAADLSGTQYIIGRWTNGGNRSWQFGLSGGKLMVFAHIGGAERTVVGSTTLAADTSHTVGWSYDGSQLRVFLNGAQDGAGSWSSAITTSSGALEIARTAEALYGNFRGSRIAFFTFAPTPAQMAALHAVA